MDSLLELKDGLNTRGEMEIGLVLKEKRRAGQKNRSWRKGRKERENQKRLGGGEGSGREWGMGSRMKTDKE